MIGNIDATIIAQKPKMAPHIPQMRENIAKALQMDPGCPEYQGHYRGKTGISLEEKKGIASQAVCLLICQKE